MGETEPYVNSISYFPDGKQMIGGSTDNAARRWDLQTGKEIVDERVVCEWEVRAVAVSSDNRWVITAGGDQDLGELKACEVETGMMKAFEGHSDIVTCIDVSVDNKLLASGSLDHTARIWDLSLNTGKLVAGPFECVDTDSVVAVRFSQDSKKLAVKSRAYGGCLEVWDIQEQKLDVAKRGCCGRRRLTFNSDMFWTTKDRSIVTAFKLEGDSEDPSDSLLRIHDFDASTLELAVPFKDAPKL